MLRWMHCEREGGRHGNQVSQGGAVSQQEVITADMMFLCSIITKNPEFNLHVFILQNQNQFNLRIFNIVLSSVRKRH